MPRDVALLVLLGLSVAAPTAERADNSSSLCGVVFTGPSDLEARLRNDRANFGAGDGVKVALSASPGGQTLWWVTQPGSRAYPAVACVEKTVIPGGFVLKPAQVACRSASPSECWRLRQDISRVQF